MINSLPSKFKIEFGDRKYQVEKDTEYSIEDPINGCPWKERDACKASTFERGCEYKTTCCCSCKYSLVDSKPCRFLCQRLKVIQQSVFKVERETFVYQ